MKLLNPESNYPPPDIHSPSVALELQLSRAASNWRKTRDAQYVKQYHDIYHKLKLLGWDGTIDLDAELPDDLMPAEYVDQNEKVETNLELRIKRLQLLNEISMQLSHEIRTPLNALIGYSELLEKTNLDETSKLNFLEAIRSNGQRILQILNYYHDLSRNQADDSYESDKFTDVSKRR